VVRLETRPTNLEGRGEVTQRALVRNALRMRPDRIIVGEVRGDEALDMLQAMNTGHDGSITTLHANSPRDALSRLETMILMAGIPLPSRAMREQVSSAIQVVIQIGRLPDGNRRIVSVSEIVGMEGDIISMQDIFTFERLGVNPEGEIRGRFRSTGVRPAFADRIEISGFTLPARLFELKTSDVER
jgi:pilus assembly protein CpaF